MTASACGETQQEVWARLDRQIVKANALNAFVLGQFWRARDLFLLLDEKTLVELCEAAAKREQHR